MPKKNESFRYIFPTFPQDFPHGVRSPATKAKLVLDAWDPGELYTVTEKLGEAISYPWRIHGVGIYANMTGVYWWDPCYHI